MRRRGSSHSLTAFLPYIFSWSGQGDLFTQHSAEPAGPAFTLKGDSLFAGLYVNELLMRLCTRHDPHPDLYLAYTHLLESLGRNDDIDVYLRYFERDLLIETGYGLCLEQDTKGAAVEASLRYAYRPEQGAVPVSEADIGKDTVQGATLLALANNALETTAQRREARDLLRKAFHSLLGERPLQSLKTMQRMRQMTKFRKQE